MTFLKQAGVLAGALLIAAGAAQAQPVTYMVDPAHTWITYESKHFGTTTSRGRFDKKAGKVVIDRAAKTGSAEITIDMNSVSSGVADLDKHLKSADFFAADQFPEGKFVGTAFKFDGDKLVEVAGNLTLRGKTNPVVLKANGFNCYENPFLKREVCGGDFETTIPRAQFDVKYGLPGIPDNVRLMIAVEAVKQ